MTEPPPQAPNDPVGSGLREILACLLAATSIRPCPNRPSRRSAGRTVRPTRPRRISTSHHFSTGPAHKHKRKGGLQLSRKEARKQARDSRKQRKAEHFSASYDYGFTRSGKRSAEENHADSPQRKKAKLNAPQSKHAPVPHPADTPPKRSADGDVQRPKGKLGKSKTALQRLAEKAEAPRAPSKLSLQAVLRTPQEEQEDAYIAYLERKLGWVKGGQRTARYGMDEEDDGLGGTPFQTHNGARCSCRLLKTYSRT